MKKLNYIIIALLFILGTYFVLTIKSSPEVCFGVNCFSVEIADEEAERSKGLMFRETLANDEGMLFIFDSVGNYPFWMKNTPLPLDIIWIDSDYRVVHIAHNTTPGSTDIIYPTAEAKYVLEINGGLSDTLGIELNSVADINLI
ncbi:MAG: DUF192 domain-containing protein [Candidatus Pacearchaeota archaeon]